MSTEDLWSPEQKARMVVNLGDFPLIAEDEAVCTDIDAVLEQRNEHARLEARISNAILDVLDAGNGIDFAFWHPFEPIADESRCRFRDQVIEQLRRG